LPGDAYRHIFGLRLAVMGRPGEFPWSMSGRREADCTGQSAALRRAKDCDPARRVCLVAR